jgi:hypothetical protein
VSYVTYSCSTIGAFLKNHRHRHAALLVAMLVCLPGLSWAQTAAPQSTTSLTEALNRARKGTELHIFYVHGMGIEPPKGKAGTQDFETSEEFRTSYCNLVHCTSTYVGRNYADKDLFELNKLPTLEYLGDKVWNSKQDWNAAAPFVDHYNLAFNDGTRIYLHEINWWPLVVSAKCRLIIATDAGLVDRDQKHTNICLASKIPDKDGRYKSYAWITTDEIQKRQPPWPKGAAFNRWLKHDILDWGFADALLAVGPMHKYLVEGIREIVLDSYKPTENQEFIIVSHSLGSYLMFSALDLQSDTEARLATQAGQATATSEPQGLSPATIEDWRKRFDDVLTKTSQAYFMANQLSLLELANLDDTKGGNLGAHLKVWGDLRTNAQIVAFSDPDDLLTWKVPCKNANSVTVTNFPVKNVTRWFGLFAKPDTAHITYDKNKHVLRAMVPKSNTPPTRPSSPCKL